MFDPLPWWARFLKWLGWAVEQDFEVVTLDHQGAVVLWGNGNNSRAKAEEDIRRAKEKYRHTLYKDRVYWVRRSITVWSD